MAAVTIHGMRDAEQAALAAGWSEEQLLDAAGTALGHALGRWFPRAGTAIAYLGKGHNAGDALVALQVLRDHFGWNIALRTSGPPDELAPISLKKWQQLGSPAPLAHPPDPALNRPPLLVLDGLLGIGGSGPLRPEIIGMTREINHLRHSASTFVAAVDSPTGVCADSGLADPDAVVADATFMIGNAKRGLLTAHGASHTGSLALVPVEVLTTTGSGECSLIAPQTLEAFKSPRLYDFHKGMAGHVGIVAGCTHFTGAAVLAAIGALRGGAGLVTLLVPHEILDLVTPRCPPEVITCGFGTFAELASHPADAWAIGCGLGKAELPHMRAMLDFIREIQSPTVIDADALNWMAACGQRDLLSARHVITPHPGEFRRLAPEWADAPRELAVREFTDRYPCTLLLKGCRTLVTRRGETIWCNSTGTPGMACGGQGDLLSGVIAAKLGLGNSPVLAASHAAWLCGRAAERAIHCSENSEESLLPSDVATHLGAAHMDWRGSNR